MVNVNNLETEANIFDLAASVKLPSPDPEQIERDLEAARQRTFAQLKAAGINPEAPDFFDDWGVFD